MDTNSIIEQIDQEIARLQRAKSELSGSPITRGPGRPKKIALYNAAHKPVTKKAREVSTPTTKRVMSPEGKSRIAAAQKLRWAKSKKAAKKAAKAAAAVASLSE